MRNTVLNSLFLSFAILFLLFTRCSVSVPSTLNVALIIPETISGSPVLDFQVGSMFGTDQVNYNNTELLPNTLLNVTYYNTNLLGSLALQWVITSVNEGDELIICCASSGETSVAASASLVYNNVLLGTISTSPLFSDKINYPYYARLSPPDDYQALALTDILKYLSDQSGLSQYLDVAIVITSTTYGVTGATTLINGGQLNVKTYQQFLPDETQLSVEANAVLESGARVIIVITNAANDFQSFLLAANELGLVGPTNIWLCFDGCAIDYVFHDGYTGPINDTLRYLTSGLIGVQLGISNGASYPEVLSIWQASDYPGAGPNSTLSIYHQYYYDVMFFYAKVLTELIDEGSLSDNGTILISADEFFWKITNTTYSGITGDIILDELGNRVPIYDIYNLRSENTLTKIGVWDEINGLQLTTDIQFFDNTTEIPDIDVRQPFDYWSCDDKEKKTDPTGKSVKIYNPGGSNPSNIKKNYYCDSFIDCENLSDESVDGCSSNYTAVFIVYGIVTGLMILLALLFLVGTIVFGFCFKKTRITASAPLFLIIVIFSCILGFASTYAWYGKPQKVACGFQPWLLGLAVVSLVAALFAKTFRIWRIFKSPMKQQVIADWELLILWGIMMLPAIVILALWTGISTPDAALETIQGEKHYVCVTGGVTGPPGGYVWFFIYVAYCGLMLVFGAFLSIVTRHVPSLFNESKLIAISIYNLAFLACIIIPVVIVLNTINPFASWIIRTTGILYAFFATLILQFLPKFVCIIFDRKKPKTKELGDLGGSGSTIGSFSAIPEAPDDDD